MLASCWRGAGEVLDGCMRGAGKVLTSCSMGVGEVPQRCCRGAMEVLGMWWRGAGKLPGCSGQYARCAEEEEGCVCLGRGCWNSFLPLYGPCERGGFIRGGRSFSNVVLGGVVG